MDYINNQQTFMSFCDTALLGVMRETKMAVIAFVLSNALECTTFVEQCQWDWVIIPWGN